MAISGIGGYNPITSRSVNTSPFSIPAIPDNITTKGQSKLSEGQIKDKLLDIARRDVANGVTHAVSTRNNTAEWLKLEQDYISFASPDRKGIINKTLSGYGQKLSMMMPNFNRRLSLVDVLMQNSRMFGTRDIGNNFINFKDSSGKLIASYSQLPNGGGMGYMEFPTDAEISRGHEFMNMWKDAQQKAGQEYYDTNTTIDNFVAGYHVDLGKFFALGATRDMTKLAAHGITYDAATGQTHVDKEKLQQATGRQIADKPTVGWKG